MQHTLGLLLFLFPFGSAVYCEYPLISEASFSSSTNLVTREPYKAVLHGPASWTAANSIIGEYLQIELKSVQNITVIGTQGRSDSREFVRAFSLSYSLNGELFSQYKENDGSVKAFPGNHDGNTVVTNVFSLPIIARYLRILPLRWGDRISMRVQLYGCDYVSDTLHFDGEAMMVMNYSLVPIASVEDTFSFRFKTIDPDGVLMYARGSQGDFIALQLINNRMVLNINLGSPVMTSMSVGSLLDDNSWHDVAIHREGKNVSLIVDRVRLDETVRGDFNRLDLNRQLYIGGVPNIQEGVKSRVNFTGCFENFFINGTAIIPEMKTSLESASNYYNYYYNRPSYRLYGVQDECPFGLSSHLTLTFKKASAYLQYPALSEQRSVNVSLEFKTYEENGLLIHHDFSGSGYFRLLLEKGKIKVEVWTPQTPGRIVLDNFDMQFNDGRWHNVIFSIGLNMMELVLDDVPMKTSRVISITNGRYFYIGGGDKETPGFLGCMRRIAVSGFPRRPKLEEILPSPEDVVLSACQILDRCNPNPCEHGGKCRQTSMEFACDCTGTGYSGAVCHTSLNPVSCQAFENQNAGTKKVDIFIDVDGSGPLDPFPVTCEFFNNGRVTTSLGHKHLSLTPVYGYEDRGSYIQDIMYDASYDQIEVFVNRSQSCKQHLYFECVKTKLFNTPYRDPNSEFVPNTWWVSRRNQMMDYWGGSLPGSRKCECGLMGTCITQNVWCNCDADLEAIQTDQGDLTIKEHLPVRQIRVGGTGSIVDWRRAKYSVGSLICEGDNIFDNIVTFRKADANIRLPRFDMGHSGDVYFEFKTTTRDGCLLHAIGPTDYIKVSIIAGMAIQFQYEAGAGPQGVTVEMAMVLNDNTWHSVRIERNRKEGSVTVDQAASSYVSELSGPVRAIHLTSDVFIGSTVDGRDGYVGCMRALMLNGELQDLRGRAEEGMYGVHSGCVGKCQSNPCLNNGTCIEGYDRYECNCRWTAFKGPICADEIGIKMLTDTMVKYEIPGNYKSTIAEDIRVGFTTTDPRGFLIGLYSELTGEYLTLAVSNSGHLKVTFDFGFERREEIYPRRTFHEGQNHEVHLTRSDSGRKLTMQVDNYEPVSWVYDAKGSADAQFNNIKFMYVGKNESMAEGFRGCISRVSFDDIYPLKFLFQQDRPSNIKVVSSSNVYEDYCGIEPIRYPEEEIETRPPLTLSKEQLAMYDQLDTSAVLGGILGIIFGALILMCFIIGRYVSRHKGDYQTHEDEGAHHAPDADWAIENSRTGHQVRRNTEMYI